LTKTSCQAHVSIAVMQTANFVPKEIVAEVLCVVKNGIIGDNLCKSLYCTKKSLCFAIWESL